MSLHVPLTGDTLLERLAASPEVIDLFAGPGGWDEGMSELGIAARGIDNDPDACATGRAAGHYRVEANIATLNPLGTTMTSWGRPEGMVTSPPCPGFSHGGKGHGRRDAELVLEHLEAVSDRRELEQIIDDLPPLMTDHRTLLALEPLRWALALGPRWLAWEQVPYVLPLWDSCAVILRGIGYSVATGIVHADEYGVPQVRRRAVLVARDASATAEHGPAALPAPTHQRWARQAGDPSSVLPRWRVMADALGWGMTARPYPAIAAGTARGGQDPMMLGGSGAREAVRRELAAGRWLSTPERPADASSEWNLETRRALRLTVAEAGVLQGFDRNYPWQGRPTSQFQQVGNAVPPPLARAIVEAVRA